MDRVPPHNLEAEQSVLGAVLLDSEALHTVMDMIQPDDFYVEVHRLLFMSMQELYQKSQPVDLITLVDHLKSNGKIDTVGGYAAVSAIGDRVPTAANVSYWAQIVKDKSLLRHMVNEATSIVQTAYEQPPDVGEFLDQAQDRILRVAMDKTTTSFQPIRKIVNDSFEIIEKYFDEKRIVTGVPTFFDELDKLTSGFQPADLVILAGRPSMGKTALALNLARNAAIDGGAKVVVFSLEMTAEQLVMRLLCSEAEVDISKLRQGFLSKGDWPSLTSAAGRLSEASIIIDDSSALSVLELKAKCRRIQAEYGIDMIIVDYLQLMRGSSRKASAGRWEEVGEISRSLKGVAKELKVPIIALSQLSRAIEQRDDKRPKLSDLRESGSIEQDADVILFIHRPALLNPKKKREKEQADDGYNPYADSSGDDGGDRDITDRRYTELIIGKQRNGPIGTLRLTFFEENTRFKSFEGRYGEDDFN